MGAAAGNIIATIIVTHIARNSGAGIAGIACSIPSMAGLIIDVVPTCMPPEVRAVKIQAISDKPQRTATITTAES
jgi:hypothetical protein